MYDCGAVIAGGYILSHIVDEDWVNDIDIYVQADGTVNDQLKRKNFLGKLIHSIIGIENIYHGAKERRIYHEDYAFYCKFPPVAHDGRINDYRGWSKVTPPYDDSFMRKNNVLSRECLRGINRQGKEFSIDIMLVKGDVKDVVKNFDLDVCKVWYDGKVIHAKTKRLKSIQDRIATLGSEYVTKFNEGNLFTRNRLIKYMQRGFEIKLKKPKKLKKTPISWEKWAVITAYNFLATQKEHNDWGSNIDGLRPANIPLSIFVLNYPLMMETEEYLIELVLEVDTGILDISWSGLCEKLIEFGNVIGNRHASKALFDLSDLIEFQFLDMDEEGNLSSIEIVSDEDEDVESLMDDEELPDNPPLVRSSPSDYAGGESLDISQDEHNWYMVLADPVMQLHYFWNSATGETTWDSPYVQGNIPRAHRDMAPDPPPL